MMLWTEELYILLVTMLLLIDSNSAAEADQLVLVGKPRIGGGPLRATEST